VRPTPPTPLAPAVPEQVSITVTTDPKGAKVIDDANPSTVWGTTPTTFSIPGSTTPRRFRLALKGYGETTLELIPNRATIELNQKLVKGAKPAVVVTQPAPPPASPIAGTPVTRPADTTTAPVTTSPPAQTGSATPAATEPKPAPPSEPKPEVKPETPAAGAGSGSAKKPPDCVDGLDSNGVPCLKQFP
jgi:hypothetical protein